MGEIAKKPTAKSKRQLFVEEYIIDLNATQAAIRAGYSPKAARQQGARLLSNASIQSAIDEAKAKRQIMTEVNQEWVIKNLVEVANRCLAAVPYRDKKGNLVTIETENGEAQAVFVFDSKGANQALKTLAEHLGMLKQNINNEISGNLGVVMFNGDDKLED